MAYWNVGIIDDSIDSAWWSIHFSIISLLNDDGVAIDDDNLFYWNETIILNDIFDKWHSEYSKWLCMILVMMYCQWLRVEW